jgi:hypothetical protein
LEGARSGVSGTLMRVLESDCRGFHLGKKRMGAPEVPHGASRRKPKGVRAWNCRITAASVLGIEIANRAQTSGTRLDAIVIGMLVSSLHATDL